MSNNRPMQQSGKSANRTPNTPRRRWHWISVPVVNQAGEHLFTVRGYTSPHLRGLAVTPGAGGFDGRYVITVLSTGYKLPESFATRATANRVAERLAELCDWNRNVKQLRSDSTRQLKTWSIIVAALNAESPGVETTS